MKAADKKSGGDLPEQNLSKLAQLRHTLFEVPWKRATLVMDGGKEYALPSKDHVFIPPGEPVFILIVPARDAYQIVFVDQIKSLEVDVRKLAPTSKVPGL